jgi:pyridoxal/pyridoxine/pyridoxamine kinase
VAVQFSNHPGYGRWRGRMFGRASIRLLVDGMEQHGILSECDGVLSGRQSTRFMPAGVVFVTSLQTDQTPDQVVEPSQMFVAQSI